MNVLVVGANGQVGKLLVNQLRDSKEHTVKAMVRREEQADAFKKLDVEVAVTCLEQSVEDIAQAARGCNAIVFTAGSGRHTGYDKTLLIDLDGAVKTIEAAEIVGIKRFIMISAIQAHRRENWHEKMLPYYAAKYYADKMLEQSELTYTIIRPGGLVSEQGTGLVSAAVDIPSGKIPREDVARTIIQSLTEENTYYQSFDLVSGEVPITKALKIL
ncbi:SDR family oxidoreductase [Neobacillus sp. CF12]|uniref:SDR family oxidoreductase n=1 Tax=Neobacillus sp. CF12 TaxID=3055864 RepID=UPI0025A216B2|nr:SDR family oxidoreductase [Neobacillus sp. CF12]MDM5331686.1 SDR family oxidoreductase [Neobacillus sp. CF12]